MIRDEFYGVLADAHEEGFGGVPADQEIALFGNGDRAVRHLDTLPEGAGLYRLVPVSASGHYDWNVRRPGATEVAFRDGYVNERAARACVGSGTLMRRRRGTDTWTEVTD